MKYLTNFISCLRITLSITLLFMTDKWILFIITYFICGVSDVIDGYLARRLNAVTVFSSKLHSIGDFVFTLVYLHILFIDTNKGRDGLILTCITIITLMRMKNLVIGKMKFNQWSIMHTIGNKLAGFTLFLLLPVWIISYKSIDWSLILVCVMARLSALEETAILLSSKFYDANRQCIIAVKKG